MYVAPLRCAVSWLAEQPYRWDHESVASLAHVTRVAAKAYCHHLVGEDVLAIDEAGFYSQAWAFAAWVKERPRTRPGGFGREYLEERRVRSAAYWADQQSRLAFAEKLRKARDLKGWGIVRLAREACVGKKGIQAIERGKWNARRETIEKLQRALGVELWVN